MYEDGSTWKKLKNVIKAYACNSNVPGYKYLISESILERCFWYIVHICTLVTTFQLIKYTWEEFMINPIITTVETFTYPINDVPHPGISVCNNNKISKMMANVYAQQLSDVSGTPKEDIFGNISGLGKFYDLNERSYGESLPVEFQIFLDKYDPGSQGYCDVYNTLKMLATPCSQLVTDCQIYGNKRDCDDIFVTELTMEGHCCIFNYLSQSTTHMSTILRENKNKSITAGDVRLGEDLTFTIVFNESDYVFSAVPSIGAQILISLPKDFPDKASGGLSEVIIDTGAEVFIEIFSTTTFSTPEVKKYPISQRNCIFQTEKNTIFGSYSYSDCIMDCKIKNIQAMCKCVPFNYIKAFTGLDFNQCTLADLECLSLHSRKWLTMYPRGYTGSSLDAEQQNSLPCSHCLPACSGTVYSVQSQKADMHQNGQIPKNFSIIHVSFTRNFGIANKQDVVFYWYEITGLFGGLCSLMMGVTSISIVEIVYFFSHIFCKRR